MTTSKVLALSLLLVSSATLARVQLHTQVDIKNSNRYGNHSVDGTCQFDTHETGEIYNHGDVKIVATLLTEQAENATVEFTIYAKNSAGEYEELCAPVIVPNYTEPASITIGSHEKGKESEGDLFVLTVRAQKV